MAFKTKILDPPTAYKPDARKRIKKLKDLLANKGKTKKTELMLWEGGDTELLPPRKTVNFPSVVENSGEEETNSHGYPSLKGLG